MPKLGDHGKKWFDFDGLHPLLFNLVEKSASRQLQSQPVLKNAKIAIFVILGIS